MEITRTGTVVVSSSIERAVKALNLDQAMQFTNKNPFTIEAAREIRRAAAVSTSTVRRYVIMQQRTISEDAQNVLLKTLEDGARGIQVIFVVLNVEALIKTVVSRCEVINLDTTSPNVEVKESHIHLARGDVALAHALGDDAQLAEEHRKSLELSKSFLQAKPKDRVGLLAEYSDVELTKKLIADMLYISSFVKPTDDTLGSTKQLRAELASLQNDVELIGGSLKLIHSRMIQL